MKTQRTTALKSMFASIVGVIGLGMAASSKSYVSEEKAAGKCFCLG